MKRLNDLRELTGIVEKIKEAYRLGFENQYTQYQKEYKERTGEYYPDEELYKALVSKPAEVDLTVAYGLAMQVGQSIEHAARNGNDALYAQLQMHYHELTGGYYEATD